jgi:biotin-(acetyl-CoA carboxylase) ligase
VSILGGMKNQTPNPSAKEINQLLDKISGTLQDIEKLKTSVHLLQVLLALQMSAKNWMEALSSVKRETFLSSLEELRQYEERLSAPDCQDIALQFEALKHLIGKHVRSTEPLQRPLVDPDA